MPEQAPTFDMLLTQLPEDCFGNAPGETLRGPPPEYSRGIPGDLPEISLDETGRDPGPDAGAGLWLKDVLGRGGMGVVNRARQPMLNRDVAIKRIAPNAPPTAARALLREARIVGQLEHPNIVPVHAIGLDPLTDLPLMVMKYASGAPWSQLLHRDGLWSGEERAGVPSAARERHVRILVEVARAVHFAHTRGVLHCDVKPANVHVGEHGEVILLDWGTAVELSDDAGRLRMSGTPSYMAPEVVDRAARVDERSDVFLLGACLHEVLTGWPPHRGESMVDTLYGIYQWEGPSFPGARPGSLEHICTRALARDPSRRPQSAAEFQAALERWLRDQGALALLEAADAKVLRLRSLFSDASARPVAVTAALEECRHAYEAVLLLSPENEEAQRGVVELLRHGFDWEMARENPAQAEVYLLELEGLGRQQPARRTRLAELEGRLAEQRRIALEFDPRAHATDRRQLQVAMSAAGLLVLGGLFGGVFADTGELTVGSLVRVGLVFNGVLWALVLVARGWILKSRVNRAYATAILGAGLCIQGLRLLAWRADLDVNLVLIVEDLLMALPSLVLANFVGRWLLLYAGMWFLLALISALTPAYAFGLQIFGFSVTGALAAFATINRPAKVATPVAP